MVGAAWVFVAASSSVSVFSSNNPSIYGQAITFTATATSGATGTVIFTVDGVAQPPLALLGSRAQFTISSLSVGAHTISAVYSGDSSYLGSTSPVLLEAVNRSLPPLSLTLTSSANPSIYGQAITFTATVLSGAKGMVTFTVDGVAQPPLALTGNQAQFTMSSLSVGTHTISAVYSGDSGSTSTVLLEAVNPLPPPLSLTLNSSANPSIVGQPVTFTASLSGGDSTLNGSVQFLNGTGSLGWAPVSNGQATLSTSFMAAGSYDIVAQYGGNAGLEASRGQVVNGMASKTTLTVNPAAILYGQVVIVTGQVGPAPPIGFAAPSGQVTFQDNGYPAGTAPVSISSGTANWTVNALSVGTHQITAIYSGDRVWGSSFARISVTVALPPLQITNAASDR
jgi:hypothetical protein